MSPELLIDHMRGVAILHHAAHHLAADYDRDQGWMSHEEALCNMGARAILLDTADELHREMQRFKPSSSTMVQ